MIWNHRRLKTRIPDAHPSLLTLGFVVILILYLAFGLGCAQKISPRVSAHTAPVILVHGLGRSSLSLWLLEQRIRNAGFPTKRFRYPSRSETIDGSAMRLAREIQQCCADRKHHLSFVTHSLGGLVVRAYLTRYDPGFRGRVVMLAPPNQGSELADILSHRNLAREILGPALVELKTDTKSRAKLAALPPGEFGIIAGTQSFTPFTGALLPGPDDGLVSLKSAHLKGAKDFLTIDHSHTFIMNSPEVAGQIIHFLRKGRFEHRDIAIENGKQTD